MGRNESYDEAAKSRALQLYIRGYSFDDISTLLGPSVKTIAKWRHRYAHGREDWDKLRTEYQQLRGGLIHIANELREKIVKAKDTADQKDLQLFKDYVIQINEMYPVPHELSNEKVLEVIGGMRGAMHKALSKAIVSKFFASDEYKSFVKAITQND